MLAVFLPDTGQSPEALLTYLIVGVALVSAGVAAMMAVRISQKKNAGAKTFTPEASKPAADDN